MKPKHLIVHCSASTWGDAAAIRSWHTSKGWVDIGYHAVILDGRRAYSSKYSEKLDGKIEPGRSESIAGSHCRAGGMNSRSLGVCLVGNPGWGSYPTKRQKYALIHWLAAKCRLYGVPVSNIHQHSDFEPGKPLCASLDMGAVRLEVQKRLREDGG